MKLSIKGILLSSLATFGVGLLLILPLFLLFPQAMRAGKPPALVAILLLLLALFLDAFNGYVLARIATPDRFIGSALFLSALFGLMNIRKGVLWVLGSFVVAFLLMSLGRAIAPKK